MPKPRPIAQPLSPPPPILGLVGWSGAGKTSLLEKLIPFLRQRGLIVAAIKHTHHTVDLDQPGKDSYRLRQAGASEVILAGRERFALLHENRAAATEPPSLTSLVARLAAADLVLVEGFRHENFPKLEIHRPELGKKLFAPEDDAILAVVTDQPDRLRAMPGLGQRPVLDLNDLAAVGEFILTWRGRVEKERL
ncbi:MAG: molybdopterin-guanine dinucleotide biosynthesis protein B [Candidatus Symbiobacter sp.]|nr:molybdopterin-guanine dinucleotide biosynthesis protein B [Candidatus Symbiobacter sp.]